MVSRAKKNKKGKSEFFWELHPWEWFKRSRGKNEKLDMKKQVYPPPLFKTFNPKIYSFSPIQKKIPNFWRGKWLSTECKGGINFSENIHPWNT